ncbi:MAG: hypothetical protein ABSE73_06560, partial [Planctomycetota bacterium]
RLALVQELNRVVKQDPTRVKPEQLLYAEQRFAGVALSAATKQMLDDKAAKAEAKRQLKDAEQPGATPLSGETRWGLEETAKKEVNQAHLNRLLLHDAYPAELVFNGSILSISDTGASYLCSLAFICFLIGRFTGAGLLRTFSAHKTLGLYGLLNVLVCFLVFLKLGWFSVLCVFLSYFFMSIMFPTIFALGIFGLGARAKKASAFIVMAIMGGAILPKLMGYVADQYDMSRGFIVPMVCFAFIAFYGFFWPKLSGAESMRSVGPAGGH